MRGRDRLKVGGAWVVRGGGVVGSSVTSVDWRSESSW